MATKPPTSNGCPCPEGVVNGVMTDLRSSIFWDGATDKLQGPPQKRLTMNGFGRLLLAKPNEK